jgi:hypothetical protein
MFIDEIIATYNVKFIVIFISDADVVVSFVHILFMLFAVNQMLSVTFSLCEHFNVIDLH